MRALPTATPQREMLRAALVAAGVTVGVAVLGSLGTDLGPWYQGLKQPAWKPPDAWFGPAWTLIFVLTAWAATRAWLRAAAAGERQRVLWVFGLNGAHNVLWSRRFFRWRRPDWALAEVVPFWLSIVALIVVARRIDRLAALLLAPYLAWVTFAAALNAAVVRLNPSP
jgi:tryptophan-rich sensory protein